MLFSKFLYMNLTSDIKLNASSYIDTNGILILYKSSKNIQSSESFNTNNY